MAMAEAKTQPTDASIGEYLASRASGDQLADCEALLVLLQRITAKKPRMWGSNIVGFSSYRYPLASDKPEPAVWQHCGLTLRLWCATLLYGRPREGSLSPGHRRSEREVWNRGS
jgi:hypothetical protein